MRLINLHTLELREFIDSERPPYVILSHTWGAEEVTLQQLQPDASTHIPFLQYKEGYLKVRNFAREGRQNGFEWGWVDTCCIDKTSSAELSEAINSMYRWYEEADSCYAYFSDVPRLDSEGQPESSLEQQFAASRWFTRGWTLQELLAPSSVVFYLNNWTVYGTKGSLRKEISIITCIPEEAIKEPEMTNFTVGQRISWVSRRQTTRPEDLSYCLLGILGVNMPMLYGEGSRAFIRLQEEVLKISTDSTIFAWPSSAIPPRDIDVACISPLAPSPTVFTNAGNYYKPPPFHDAASLGPWTVTNRGLRIEGLPIVDGQEAWNLLKSVGYPAATDIVYVVALIGCYTSRTTESELDEEVGIVLYKNRGGREEIYYRLRTPESLLHFHSSIRKMSVKSDCIIELDPFDFNGDRIPQKLDTGLSKWILRETPEREYGFNDFKIYNQDNTEDIALSIYMSIISPTQFVAFSNNATAEKFFVTVAVDFNTFTPWVYISSRENDHGESASYSGLVSDQFSHALQDGKVVKASLVRGMKDGKRILFLDVYIKDKI